MKFFCFESISRKVSASRREFTLILTFSPSRRNQSSPRPLDSTFLFLK